MFPGDTLRVGPWRYVIEEVDGSFLVLRDLDTDARRLATFRTEPDFTGNPQTIVYFNDT